MAKLQILPDNTNVNGIYVGLVFFRLNILFFTINFTWLFLNINSTGSTNSVTGYKPFFSSSQYNNAISRYKQITTLTGVYGWMNVYDKKWYKQKIQPTIGNAILFNVSFNGAYAYY